MINKMTRKYTVFFIILVLLTAISGCSSKQDEKQDVVLKSWSDTSQNKEKIISFIKTITDKNSKDYIPVQDRIATFDMDGTIVCEEPHWLELAVAEDRIAKGNNKELSDKVNRLNEDLRQNPQPAETSQLIDEVTGEAFLNVSQEDFIKYMEAFMNNDKPEFTGIKYKDTFYKPMMELISYLLDNQFQVYIVSGSEQGVIWGACKEDLPKLPRSHEIGADITLKPIKETDTTDKNYVFQQSDELVRQNSFRLKDLKMDKVYNIYHQIGQKPILAFGNTDGDFSMLNYAKSNKQYKTLSFLLCHDDDKREYDYNTQQRADWNEKAKENDWNVVFMSKEFKQVFMKDTTKK